MPLVEQFGSIDDLKENPETAKHYSGMWVFEYERGTLIEVPYYKIPSKYTGPREVEAELGPLVRKEKLK